MAVQIIRSKKQKKKETIIFTILCVLIVLLIGANIWAVYNLISSRKPKGSPSVVSDNGSVVGFVLKDTKATSDAIKFNTKVLNPGEKTSNQIRINNYGNDDLYLKLSAVFEISIDGTNYEEKDFLSFEIKDTVNWSNAESLDEYYSLIRLPKRDFIDINTDISIKQELEQSEAFQEYKDKMYRVTIKIDTLGADKVNTESATQIIESWKN